MADKCYERLAAALEALPSGFPQTPSRVELRLLEKTFSPEEADLAGRMSRKYESVEELAARAGIDAGRVASLLKGLLPRALVRQQVVDGKPRYRLGPFIVGWYEAAMLGPMRKDLEFARLFEQFMREGGGERILAPRPGVMGVVPVRGSLRKELLQPYDDIDAHFARHERFAVIDCVCHLERDLLGGTCTKPVRRCAFVGVPPQTPLSENILDREQALELFTRLEDEGHVHTGLYGFTFGADTPQFIGCCNRCGDCCGLLRGIEEYGISEGPQRSNYRAVKDDDACSDCATCVDRCQVKAITEREDGGPVISREKCLGCGLCVTTCPSDAIVLEPVSPQEWFDVPSSFEEWEERRLEYLRRTAPQ